MAFGVSFLIFLGIWEKGRKENGKERHLREGK